LHGILLSEKKAENIVVTGTIKKVENKEFIIEMFDALP